MKKVIQVRVRSYHTWTNNVIVHAEDQTSQNSWRARWENHEILPWHKEFLVVVCSWDTESMIPSNRHSEATYTTVDDSHLLLALSELSVLREKIQQPNLNLDGRKGWRIVEKFLGKNAGRFNQTLLCAYIKFSNNWNKN